MTIRPFCVTVRKPDVEATARYRGEMPRAPQSRSGRYEELTSGELADVVEHAYDQDQLPDWELVFELSRRALIGEPQAESRGAVGAGYQT